MDLFFAISFMIIALIFIGSVIIYFIDMDGNHYENKFKNLLKIRYLLNITMFFYVNVINLLVAIFPFKIRFFLIIQFIYTAYSFLFVMYDFFHNRNSKNNMLIDYKKEVFKQYKLKELFETRETQSSLKEDVDFKGQIIAKVKIDGIKSFIFKGTSIVLVPKYDFTEIEYDYLFNYLNAVVDISDIDNTISIIPFSFEKETSIFKYCSVDSINLKYSSTPYKIDRWKEKYLEKITIVSIVVVAMLVLIVLALFSLANEFNWKNVIELGEKIAKWLFN